MHSWAGNWSVSVAIGDMDHDRDVDLADFALFQNAFGGQLPMALPCVTPVTSHHPPRALEPQTRAITVRVLWVDLSPAARATRAPSAGSVNDQEVRP